MHLFLLAALFGWITVPQTTTWGGDHIEMQVTADGAHLEFDCAVGTIDGPLKPDAQGAFTVKGTFTPESRGPVRDDAPSRTRKAVYSGTIKDDAMSLRLQIDGDDGPAQTYTLVRDRPGNVRKCR